MIIPIILLSAVLAFAQNAAAPAAPVPGGVSAISGNISPAEISAAREMLAKDHAVQHPAQNQKVQPVNEFDVIESIDDAYTDADADIDTDIDDDDYDEDETGDMKRGARRSGLSRYERIVFSKSLPSAFYEIQGMVPADYPLKPGDNLELSLWGAVERQLTLSVNNQGNVFVEGVGLVNVANLTLGEAEKLITKRLQSVYSGIVQGRISVNLRTTRLSPTKIFVMGAVRRPGGYDLPGNANVFLALYRAGGPSNIGSVRNIVIRRASGDSTLIDLYDFLLRGKKIGEGLLRDGDLVFVPKAEKLVKARGAIGVPAIYELKADETLRDLLSFAGGFRPNIDHTISLWRLNDVGAPILYSPGMARDFADGSKTFQLQNGDSIFVSPSRRPNDNAIRVVGSVYYPGFYTWTEGMGVREAVELAGGTSPEAYLNRAIIQRQNADNSFSYFDDDFENKLDFKLLPSDRVIILNSRILKNWRTVSVAGYVKRPRRFEWQEGINIIDLIVLCGGFLPSAAKDEVIVERVVPGELAIKKIRLPLKGLSVEHNKDLILEPGDRVVVNIEDTFYEQEIVDLTGAFRNPGSYSLAYRGETFREFMKRLAKLDTMAYIKGGQLYRKILSSDVLGTETINRNYRVAFDFERVLNGKDSDITLQVGDSIHVPFEQITVNVTGEVISSGHILWQKGWKAKDYLKAAGGLTRNGDEDRIILTYANGQKVKPEDAKLNPDPGSVIYVSHMPTPEPIKITEIIAVIGSVASVLTAMVTLVFLVTR